MTRIPMSPEAHDRLAERIAARRSADADEVVARLATRAAFRLDELAESIDRDLQWRRVAYRRAA